MPTPIRWNVPRELSPEEARVAAKLQRSGKFYAFAREIRAELFDEAFQAELSASYRPRGVTPLPPALLAMVTLLQAYDQVGDAEAVVAAAVDQRWQLVLGCLGATDAPFSQGALVKFRERMIAHDLDRKLLDRTVALAKQTGGFGWQHLRAALDSSPLIGAGRVEDTWNLLGRALRAVVTCAAATLKIPRDQVLQGAGVTLLGAPSLKAALDIDWGDPAAQAEALARLLAEVDRVETWVAAHVVTEAPAVQAALTALRRVLTQDLEPDPITGQRRIRRGVAADRMPSLGDPEMRHGRKTRTRLFTGYKRHVMKLVDADLIVGVVVRPANEPEHHALALLEPDVVQHGPLAEVQMDRGYLGSPRVGVLSAQGVAIRAKAWTSTNRGRFPKQAFTIDLAAAQVVCPAQQRATIPVGATVVHFSAAVCQPCALRPACTTATRGGRSIAIHAQEALLQTLRAHQRRPEGRARLRERTTVEHALARVDQIQGPKARYKGVRKNTLDLRRVAVIANLQRLARLPKAA